MQLETQNEHAQPLVQYCFVRRRAHPFFEAELIALNTCCAKSGIICKGYFDKWDGGVSKVFIFFVVAKEHL